MKRQQTISKKSPPAAREKQTFALVEAFSRVDDPTMRAALLTVAEGVAASALLSRHTRTKRAKGRKSSQ